MGNEMYRVQCRIYRRFIVALDNGFEDVRGVDESAVFPTVLSIVLVHFSPVLY